MMTFNTRWGNHGDESDHTIDGPHRRRHVMATTERPNTRDPIRTLDTHPWSEGPSTHETNGGPEGYPAEKWDYEGHHEQELNGQ
jgi:hypothetical protein